MEGINEVETKILWARTQSIACVCDLGDEIWAKDLFRIVVAISHISGGKLPENAPKLDMFLLELSDFLNQFGYSEYGLLELTLAFRLNISNLALPQGVIIEKVSLKTDCLSIEYIADILNNYSKIRNLLDKKIINIADGYKNLQ